MLVHYLLSIQLCELPVVFCHSRLFFTGLVKSGGDVISGRQALVFHSFLQDWVFPGRASS